MDMKVSRFKYTSLNDYSRGFGVLVSMILRKTEKSGRARNLQKSR